MRSLARADGPSAVHVHRHRHHGGFAAVTLGRGYARAVADRLGGQVIDDEASLGRLVQHPAQDTVPIGIADPQRGTFPPLPAAGCVV